MANNYSKMYNKKHDFNNEKTSVEEVLDKIEEESKDLDLDDIEKELESKPVWVPAKVVNAAVVNVRSKASMNDFVVTTLNEGTDLYVKKENDEWYAITTASGVEGYMMAKFIELK